MLFAFFVVNSITLRTIARERFEVQGRRLADIRDHLLQGIPLGLAARQIGAAGVEPILVVFYRCPEHGAFPAPPAANYNLYKSVCFVHDSLSGTYTGDLGHRPPFGLCLHLHLHVNIQALQIGKEPVQRIPF